MIGFVYAISCGDFVKIGWARDPVRRLSELNVGSPVAHELLGYMPGPREYERDLHARFSAARVRGEWFMRTKAVDAFLASLIKYAPADRSEERSEHHYDGSALNGWLKSKGISRSEFAGMVGVTEAAVGWWARGSRMPRTPLMKKITKITGGEITHSSFIRETHQ